MTPPAKFFLTPGLELGFARFDDPHRDLIERLNALHALAPNAGDAVPADGLREYVEAFIAHMRAEIAILRDLDYPDTDAHEVHHGQVEDALMRFLDRYDAAPGTTDVVSHLVWCLLEDAIKADLDAKYFLIEHGA